MPWHWAALSLGALSLLLLLAQIILVGLGFHYLVQQGSCCHGPQCLENLSSGLQALQGSCQFCPAGWLWHAGRCYYFSSAKRNWEQSKEDCCSREAQLVIIQANSTLAFLTRVSHKDIFHVGLKLSSFRSEWKWLDGTTLKGLFPIQPHDFQTPLPTLPTRSTGYVSQVLKVVGVDLYSLRYEGKMLTMSTSSPL
ncbi:oxidized low-density lipoprotein receptor 1-like [Coturnix japonica]|uniref:oxidized low-density lipoprotein receptor 1-like n=1 Tax=Coturnix japonica TaxID=93934 RepID=UPI0013A5CB00|nr:oxidized low-density lipoprotein receptor 1-like [Coturnix japonica]